jgi:short-subunit dehydrogenase
MDAPRKTALVTGGSRGLGLEVARLLAQEGYRITVVGRSSESIQAALRSFPADGHRGWALDLAHPSDTRDLLRRLEGERFDLLINNAGASRFGPLDTLSPGVIEGLIWLNFTAPALLCREFVRTCQPGATLVNVTSIVGTVPMPGNSVYSAAKAGLRTLTECLWFEVRDKGVQVVEFRPMSLKTGFHRQAGAESIAGRGVATDPAVAARDLLRALSRKRDFVVSPGLPARIMAAINRILPRRLVIGLMGKRSARGGYLTRQPR